MQGPEVVPPFEKEHEPTGRRKFGGRLAQQPVVGFYQPQGGEWIAVVGVVIYNRLIRSRNRVDAAWSDIDVQLKRRYELIPNLVETVKGYAEHEKSTFEEVTNARSQAMQASGPEAKAAAEGNLSRVLKSLFAVAEAYPEIREMDLNPVIVREKGLSVVDARIILGNAR